MTDKATSHPTGPRHERIDTAIHEAGHVVMGCVLGRYPKSADIVRAADNAGHTEFDDDVPPRAKRWLDDSNEKREYLRTRVLITLAGAVARDIKDPGRVWDISDQNDWELAKDYLEQSMSWDDDHDGNREKLKIEAVELLRRHWKAVEAVAAVLIEREKITREEIVSLFGPA